MNDKENPATMQGALKQSDESDFKDIPIIGIRRDGRFVIHANGISKAELMHEIDIMERFYRPLMKNKENIDCQRENRDE